MNHLLDQAVEAFIEQLLLTPEYQAYLKEKDRISDDEKCLNNIRRLRQLSFDLQNLSDEQRLHEGALIERECDELCEDVRVLDFMQAETDFIRLYQEILQRILERIDIEE
ncbi:MAG: YlbF family regulator [Lachnospiraceae bacterium]|nr:YlbF family regulator [Lachnospiraceae bacterium]